MSSNNSRAVDVVRLLGVPAAALVLAVALWKKVPQLLSSGAGSSGSRSRAASEHAAAAARQHFSPEKIQQIQWFRKHGHEMVDFIADYHLSVGEERVLSNVAPGYLQELLPSEAPQQPESWDQVMEDVRTKILPGVTHWQSPYFAAFYPANHSPPAMLGEMLSAGLNVIGFSWHTSPALTELEICVTDWVARMLNLPPKFMSGSAGGGCIQGTASESLLVALLAARASKLAEHGLSYTTHQAENDAKWVDLMGRFTAYSSDQAHFSMQKASMISGLVPSNMRFIPSRPEPTGCVLDPEALQLAIQQDLEKGLIPFFVCATIATTNTAAVDPIAAIGQIAKQHKIWMHVDAAYGGSYCVLPENQHLLNGMELARSFNFNAHKAMLVNFDCSLLFIDDREPLMRALAATLDILKNKATDGGKVLDYKDWQVAQGRRFRALKLWFVLRHYGVSGVHDYLRAHQESAKHFARRVTQHPNLEVVFPQRMGLVCFSIQLPGSSLELVNSLNAELMQRINDEGLMYLVTTRVGQRVIVRFATGGTLTERSHVDRCFDIVARHTEQLVAVQEAASTS